ncbi:MAG: hypothetical protein ABIA91_01700 [Patescibacteria group bacterium]
MNPLNLFKIFNRLPPTKNDKELTKNELKHAGIIPGFYIGIFLFFTLLISSGIYDFIGRKYTLSDPIVVIILAVALIIGIYYERTQPFLLNYSKQKKTGSKAAARNFLKFFLFLVIVLLLILLFYPFFLC